MLNRKHIRVPKTHDPGKGHPTEHLAYMTPEEMEMLRVLTDGTISRGPKGIPSFVYSDSQSNKSMSASQAAAYSQAYNAGYRGTSPSSYSTGSTGKAGSSPASSPAKSSTSQAAATAAKSASAPKAPSAPSGQAKSSTSMAAATASRAPAAPSGGSKSGSTPTSRGPAASMAAAKASAAPMAPGTGGPPRSLGGIGSPSKSSSDSKTQQAAASAVAPNRPSQNMMRPGYSFSPADNEARLDAVRRGSGVISGALPGSTDAQAQRRTVTALQNSIAENPAFGVRYSQRSLNMLPKAVIGEARDEGDVGRAAVANAMMNRLSLGISDPASYGYLGGGSIQRMMRGIDAAGVDPNRPFLSPNSGYRTTKPGTEAYADGVRAVADAMSPYSEFSQTATPRTLVATHYYNPAISNPKWGAKRSTNQFDTVGNHVFGNAEPTGGQVAALRGQTAPADTGGFQTASETARGYVPRPVPRPANLRGEPPRPKPKPERTVAGMSYTPDLPKIVPRPTPRPERTVAGMSFTPALPVNVPRPTPRPERSAEGMSYTPALPAAMPQPPRPTPKPAVQGPPRPLSGDPRVNIPPGSFPVRAETTMPMDPRVGLPAGGMPAAPVWADNTRTVSPGHWGREEENYLTQTGAMNVIKNDPYAATGYAAMQNPDGSGLMMGGDTGRDNILGRYVPSTNSMAVQTGLSPAQYAATLGHELGHVGSYKINGGYPQGFAQEEVRQRLVDSTLSPRTFTAQNLDALGYLANPQLRSGMGMSFTPSLPKKDQSRVPQEQGSVQQVDVRPQALRQPAGTLTAPYEPKAPRTRPFNGLGSPGLPPGYAERYGLGPKPSETPPSTGGWFKAATDAVNTGIERGKEIKQQVDKAVQDVEKQYGPITEGKVKVAYSILGINPNGKPAKQSKFPTGNGAGNQDAMADPQVRAIVAQVLANDQSMPPPAPAPADFSYFQNVKTREQALRELLGEEWNT